MKARYVGKSFGIDGLTNGKIYEILCYEDDSGAFRVIDDSDEDYLYSPKCPKPCANPSHIGGRWEVIEDDEYGTLEKVINTPQIHPKFIDRPEW